MPLLYSSPGYFWLPALCPLVREQCQAPAGCSVPIHSEQFSLHNTDIKSLPELWLREREGRALLRGGQPRITIRVEASWAIAVEKRFECLRMVTSIAAETISSQGMACHRRGGAAAGRSRWGGSHPDGSRCW